MGLIVTRDAAGTSPITLTEWKSLVELDPELRLRTEPYCAVNPRTGTRLTVDAGEADAEMLLDGQWLPLLRYRNGALVCDDQPDLEDPTHPVRVKIASIAAQLKALVTSDDDFE
jgi:hypothetical protein